MGRHPKLTPETKARFVQAITAGAFPETAARFAGFSPASLYRYLRGTTPAQVEFREAAQRATTDLEVRLAATVARAVLTDPRWAITMLERRFPERRARRALADEAADEAAGGSSATTDERVVLDPNLLHELVPRVLETGQRLRAGQAGDRERVVPLNRRAPRGVASDEEDAG